MRPRWYAFARRRGTEAVRPRTVTCTRSALLAFHCERRERVRARDILNLGTAMGRSLTVRRVNERWHPPEQRPEPGPAESGRSGARKDAQRRPILPHPGALRLLSARDVSHRTQRSAERGAGSGAGASASTSTVRSRPRAAAPPWSGKRRGPPTMVACRHRTRPRPDPP